MRSKACRFCETRIPGKASICPYCYKYQWNALVPAMLAGLFLVVVTGLVIGWKYGFLRGKIENLSGPRTVEMPAFGPETEGFFPPELYDEQAVDEQAPEAEPVPVKAPEKTTVEAKKKKQSVSKKPQAKKPKSWRKGPVKPSGEKALSVETTPSAAPAKKTKAVESVPEETRREISVSEEPEAQTSETEDVSSPMETRSETSISGEPGPQTAGDEASETQVDIRPLEAQVEETATSSDSGDTVPSDNSEEQ